MPCPLRSTVSSPGTNGPPPECGRRGRGASASAPVSSTATVAPVPSYPAAHASGAPTCGTLSARSTSTFPSSQSFVMPPVKRAARVGAVTASQKSSASSLSVAIAAPLMLARSRTLSAPAGAVRAARVRTVPAYSRDQRQLCVRVSLLDQLGDVEQLAIEPAGGQKGLRLVGDHVRVAPDGLRLHPARRSRAVLDRGAVRPSPLSVTVTTSPVISVTLVRLVSLPRARRANRGTHHRQAPERRRESRLPR